MDRVKRIWYLSHMRAAKVQASLRIRAVSPEPPLLAHTSSESRGTFRQKARSQAPLNGWACAVKICHDGMLEDTNSLDGAHIVFKSFYGRVCTKVYRNCTPHEHAIISLLSFQETAALYILNTTAFGSISLSELLLETESCICKSCLQ